MKVRILAAMAALSIVSNAYAAAIVPGIYQLQNHPDGSARPPLYGMRLDELVNVTGGHDVFTFDFNHANSDMRLAYDGSTIHIYGQAFGGRDAGTNYSPTCSGLWEIDFTYTAVVANAPADDDLRVTGADGANTGTIKSLSAMTCLAANTVIGLSDFGMGGYKFRLGDEDNDLGHRGYNGISGWGWMNHGGRSHVASSDWLFTAIYHSPEPGTMLILVLGAALRSRRRR